MATTLQTLSGRSVAVAVVGRLAATGRIAPRLVVPLSFEVTDAPLLRLDHVVVRLTAGGELIGIGQLAGNVVHQRHGTTSPVHVEIPTTHRLLEVITDALGHHSETALTMQPYGVISWGLEEDGQFRQESLLDQGMGHSFGLSRSDWYASVLSPVRQSEFVFLEVAVPSGNYGEPWRAALEMLGQAEAAWATGDDDAVFGRLRGALDAIPGDKQHIFDAVTDPAKRNKIDALTKAYGEFLHLGRHVGKPQSETPGRFPIDHSDAGFVIAQMKVLLSYASRLVS